MIQIISPNRYLIEKKSLKEDILHYLEKTQEAESHINIVFVGRRKMKSIAKTYAKDDIIHPVLSFNYAKDNIGPSGDKSLLGEIIICYPQAVLLAAERGRDVDSTIKDLTLHGLNNLLK